MGAPKVEDCFEGDVIAYFTPLEVVNIWEMC